MASWYGGDFVFVLEFADQLLEDVFDADDAGGQSEFIDYNGEMALALLEFAEEIEERLGFGHDEHVVHDLADFHVGNALGRGSSDAGPVLGLGSALFACWQVGGGLCWCGVACGL